VCYSVILAAARRPFSAELMVFVVVERTRQATREATRGSALSDLPAVAPGGD